MNNDLDGPTMAQLSIALEHSPFVAEPGPGSPSAGCPLAPLLHALLPNGHSDPLSHTSSWQAGRGQARLTLKRRGEKDDPLTNQKQSGPSQPRASSLLPMGGKTSSPKDKDLASGYTLGRTASYHHLTHAHRRQRWAPKQNTEIQVLPLPAHGPVVTSLITLGLSRSICAMEHYWEVYMG